MRTINNHYVNRIQSIDLLRGVIILLMTLDHVRDFFGVYPYSSEDLSHVSIGLFLTRWITNLCAPTFMLLTGISAYLYGLKVTKTKLSLFLIKRGLFLILLEVSIVSLSWTFQFYPHMILQVIWALGVSMVLLSLLVWLPRFCLLLLSLLIIFLHNCFDHLSVNTDHFLGIFWYFLHVPFDLPVNKVTIHVGYPILPWPAVMAFGYCIGHWMQQSPATRNIKFVTLGFFALLLFATLHYFHLYGDPLEWHPQMRGSAFTILSFLKVTKYPPSLFYILETIGIVTLLWPLWESWQGTTSRFVSCFGKVPMFYYLIHIAFIHLLATLYSRLYFHMEGGWWQQPSGIPIPSGYHFNIGFVYVVWVSVILMLYPACSWYKQYKETHQSVLLQYL